MDTASFKGYGLALPDWVREFRPHQTQAITEIVESLAIRPVTFLDAPTGAGKTLIAEVVRQIVAANNWGNQALYLCTTKTLQNQFLDDYPYAKVIKGRANYPTLDEPERFATPGVRHLDGSNCTAQSLEAIEFPACDACLDNPADLDFNEDEDERFRHCFHCHPYQECPYRVAKKVALGSSLAVANTAYFLTEANYIGTFGVTKPTDIPPFRFIIVDEADTLESVLMSHIELVIPRRLTKELAVPLPKSTVSRSWLEWVSELIVAIEPKVIALEDKIKHTKLPPPELQRELDGWDKYLTQCFLVQKNLTDDPDNWIYNGQGGAAVSLRPIVVNKYTENLFFRHGEKFLLMSATMISPHQAANDLGLSPEQWGEVLVDSSFPKERRPIVVRPTVSMTHKTADADLPKLAEAIERILTEHPHDRILVHTVSYDRTRYLADYFQLSPHADRILSYDTASEREKILDRFRATPAGVLLAPSLDRGVDLPYDACRVVVVAKVPWPNLGDPQVAKRFYGTSGGKSWFAVQTIRSLVQMTGRGMRHADDSCISYVLDDQFRTNLWRHSRGLMPRWWTEAVIWEPPT